MSNPNMPNIWGEGKLFAFSGLDGETDWAHTLVASATAARAAALALTVEPINTPAAPSRAAFTHRVPLDVVSTNVRPLTSS